MFKFIGHDNWRKGFPVNFGEEAPTTPSLEEYIKQNNQVVTIKRNLQFFYDGEVTTLGRLREHYTNFAIDKLTHDHFIEISE